MFTKKLLFLSLVLLGFFWAGYPLNQASAQICQLCVVTIGAGLGLSRWIGIDDVISSVWIGALAVSVILGTLTYLRRKNWSFQDDGVVITLTYLLLIYIPLYYVGIIGESENIIFGLDKIIFGSIVGAVAIFVGHWTNLYMKKKNNGKAFFPYQKVVVPVVTLLLISVIVYLLITWKII